MNRKRELARALADLWNEEIPPGTRVLLRHGGERLEAETLATAWASFDVPVIQVCCYHTADLKIVRLRDLEPVEALSEHGGRSARRRGDGRR